MEKLLKPIVMPRKHYCYLEAFCTELEMGGGGGGCKSDYKDCFHSQKETLNAK